MNRWLQRKIFICVSCGMPYLHDLAYEHVLFRCVERASKQHAVHEAIRTSAGEKALDESIESGTRLPIPLPCI